LSFFLLKEEEFGAGRWVFALPGTHKGPHLTKRDNLRERASLGGYSLYLDGLFSEVFCVCVLVIVVCTALWFAQRPMLTFLPLEQWIVGVSGVRRLSGRLVKEKKERISVSVRL